MTDLHYLPVRHDHIPADGSDLTAWEIEQALALRGDYAEDGWLQVLRRRLGWTVEQWDYALTQLVDLADEIEQATITAEHARRRCAETEHADVLDSLAAGPIPAGITALADAVFGPVPRDEVTARRHLHATTTKEA